MNRNRQWLLAKRPEGMIGESNFDLVERSIPAVGDNQILIKNLYFSFDPTQRNWMVDRPSYLPPVAIGEVMRSGTVAQIVQSNHGDFAEGELVQTMGGWQDYAVVTPGEGVTGVTKIPEGVTPEMMLSVIGLTGITAYFGLLELGQPQAGDTVLVSGAAGATGSVASQIAKIKGCRVVGIAGGPEKCRWLTEVAGLDAVIDYKQCDLDGQIAATCPNKWNVFFDNVGGETLEAALNHLDLYSRVVLCGGISGYNAEAPIPGPSNLMNLVTNRSRMEGFIILDYMPRAMEAIQDLLGWVMSGDLQFQVDVQEGFENIPNTLRRLYTGENHGKQLLKLADPS